jgi:hypothetical protein
VIAWKAFTVNSKPLGRLAAPALGSGEARRLVEGLLNLDQPEVR